MTDQGFYSTPSQEINAQELTDLIVDNTENWRLYLPVTVEKNNTLLKSVLFLVDVQANEAEKSMFLFGLRDIKTSVLCGLIYLKNIDWETGEGELAYAIDHNYGGRGWMSKAVQQISKKAFEMGLNRLKIIAHRSNKASVAVAIKSNYIWKKTLEKEFTPTGKTPVDMELYILSKPR